MSVWRRLVVPAAALVAALGVAGCGEDDFENNPRPPAPIELTARISDRDVVVSPAQVGGGLATITVSNQSRRPTSLTLDGPTEAVGELIPAGGVGQLKANLEQGRYEVSGGAESNARKGRLDVGPERPSSQNELLLP